MYIEEIMGSDDFTEIQKFVVAASPPLWKDFARELHDAALLLLETKDEELIVADYDFGVKIEKSHISRTFLLLAGLSIENLLKAIMVTLEPELVANGKLNKKIRSHKLLFLASHIDGITLSEDELQFCQIAQEAIPYWGRYPTPLHSNELTLEKVATESLQLTYKELYSRLDQHLYKLLRNGWNGPHGMKLVSHFDSTLDENSA
jgi:hypothetical protein